MEPRVALTPRIRAALDIALQSESLQDPTRERLSQYGKHDTFLLLSDVQRLSRHLQDNRPADKTIGIWVHELLQGSGIELPQLPPKKPKDPELVKRLARLKAEQENREYEEMVNDVTSRFKIKTDDRDMVTYKSQMGVGMNLIAAMLSIGLAGYMAAKNVMSETEAIIVGCVCCIGAMGVESVLFVIRGSRADKDMEKREQQKKADMQRTMRSVAARHAEAAARTAATEASQERLEASREAAAA